MSELVKKRKKWGSQLSQELRHIVWCERCGKQLGLQGDIAHSMKRRFINTKELYWEAIKVCRDCHNFIEYGTKDDPGTHERMRRLVLEIRERRNNYE